MQESDYYYRPSQYKSAEIKIDKSTFIGHCQQVTTPEDATDFLEKIRKEHYNANHNCWAYKLGQNGLITRSSDDGEPRNSAGPPIQFVVDKSGLNELMVIVTRYFGGKKLGVGGLVRAYSEAAQLVLEDIATEKVVITKGITVFCGYEDISTIKRLLSEYSQSEKEDYADTINIDAQIPISQVDEFTAKVIDLTQGRAGWRLTPVD
ncbi:MAG: YigZ family protein [Candidatus Kapaibacteriales bacterium]